MKIRISKTLGYCPGVRRAMDTAFRQLSVNSNKPVYSHGELIHNAPALSLLQKKGLKLWSGQEEGCIIIRAHGLPPEEMLKLSALNLEVKDATCPRVRAIQKLVAREAGKGREVIIWGKADHPEVIGILGFAAGKGHVADAPSAIKNLPIKDDAETLLVSQTTQNAVLWPEMVDAIKARWPEAMVYNTICEATLTRQKDVRMLAAEVEALVIVGGKTSGNTARLADIGRQAGLPTFLAEDVGDLEPAWFSGIKTVGLAAGASTSTWQIAQIMQALRAMARSRKDFGSFWPRFLRVMVLSGLFSALGMASLAVSAGYLLGGAQAGLFGFIFFLTASLNLMRDFSQGRSRSHSQAMRVGDPDRLIFLAKYAAPLKIFCLMSTLIAISAAPLGGWMRAVVLLTAYPAAAAYLFLPRPGSLSLVRALGSPLVLSAGWAALITAAALPSTSFATGQWLPAFFVAGSVFGHIFVLSLLADVLGAQGDRIFGRPTLPTIFGEKVTRRLLTGFLLIWAAFLALGLSTNNLPHPAVLLLLSGPLYNFLLIPPLFKHSALYGFYFEALMFSQLLLSGLLVSLWQIFPW